jgi:hypothetical protein
MRWSIAAIMLTALSTPCFAEDAQVSETANVLMEIMKNPAKQKTYCEMQEIQAKIFDAENAENKEEAEKLNAQVNAKAKELGPDYEKVTKYNPEVSPESPEGKRLLEAYEAIEKACNKE